MGASEAGSKPDFETHLTGEGVAGGGGRVAGASIDWVSVKRAVGRFGGTRK